MPVKRKTQKSKNRMVARRIGAGFFSNLGNAIMKGHDFLKSNKIVSTVGKALGSVGVPLAGQIGDIAGSLGYGKPRRKPRKKGGNWKTWASKAHGFVKDKKLISAGLNHFGHPKLGAVASALGYGAKRKPRKTIRMTRKRGRGTEQVAALRF